MLFIDIKTIAQITEIIGHNANDTVAEIVSFHDHRLAITLMDRLQHINHFAFHDVEPAALNLFIDAIGVRFSNALPHQQALIIELGENESVFSEDIKKILKDFGLNLALIQVIVHTPVAPTVSVPRLPSSNSVPTSPRIADTSQMHTPATPINVADKTIYESPLSPRSPRKTDGIKIELQDFASVGASNNQQLLSEITDSDLTTITEKLTELNAQLTATVKNLTRFQLDAATVQQSPPVSGKNASSEQRQKIEQDFLSKSSHASSPIPKSYPMNLAALAVEDSAAYVPNNQKTLNVKDTSSSNSKEYPLSIPPISKQAIPTAEELAKVRTWWHDQLAKPPKEPPPRLKKVLRELQNEDRKAQKLPLIDWAAVDEKNTKEKEKETGELLQKNQSATDKEVNDVPPIIRSVTP